jgi:signal transduction histidine kinase
LNRLSRLLPRSLVGRVYALYSITLLVFVGSSLALFYHFEFGVEMEDAQARAETLAAVIVPTVSDSAVIGDDDTIARTLDRAIDHSRFASAAFIDLKGRQVRAERHDVPEVEPPAWLTALVASRVYDTNTTIAVGGRDYGVLRLRFAPDLIAGDLWRPARAALLLAALSLVGGLVLIRLPLVSWLGHLERLRSLEQDLSSGDALQRDALDASAPIEFRQTFEVLNRAAENLQAQREQAAVTLGAIGDAVLTLDADGTVVLANPAAGLLFEQPVQALLGRPVGALLPEAFGDRGPLQAWRGRRTERTGPDGQPRVLDTTLSPILSNTGQPVGHVLAGRDITEQHALDQRLRSELARREAALTALRGVLEGLSPRAAPAPRSAGAPAGGGDDIGAISLLISGLVASLQERSEQLNAIFALSPDGFVSFGADHCVSYVNAAFVRLTGIAEEAVLGLDEAGFSNALATICSPETRDQWLDIDELRQSPLADGVGAGPRRRAVITVERPARRVLEVGLRQGESAALSQVFHLRDITHETEVDQMKSEFLSTAAHELRTPMASVFGFCELLLHRQPTPERQREMLEIIHRQTQRMTTILNELLDLARIEARRGTDFTLRTLDLSQLVRDAVTDFKPPGNRGAPELLALTAEARVRVDRNKMHQALANVLSNAYKYSPGGGPVRVRLVPGEVAVNGPADQPAEWGIRIEDAGIGMTPAQLARVSERFYRADASGNIPGTGLGMSIVKEIVGLLGGRLALASEFGRGTQVTLWLPAVMRRPDVSPSQWGNSSLMDTA